MPRRTERRQRVRFDSVHHQVRPDGRCRIGVRLEWDGEAIESEVEGLETHHGRIRACAQATLDAAAASSQGKVGFELLGVKAVRAFDGWVVVVRVNAPEGGDTVRLLGSAACEEENDLIRTTAKAVLDATNRILEKYVPEGED